MRSNPSTRVLKPAALSFLTLLMSTMLSGCLVAGVSSNGGAFIWPGGLGLVLVIVVVILLLRRR